MVLGMVPVHLVVVLQRSPKVLARPLVAGLANLQVLEARLCPIKGALLRVFELAPVVGGGSL